MPTVGRADLGQSAYCTGNCKVSLTHLVCVLIVQQASLAAPLPWALPIPQAYHREGDMVHLCCSAKQAYIYMFISDAHSNSLSQLACKLPATVRTLLLPMVMNIQSRPKFDHALQQHSCQSQRVIVGNRRAGCLHEFLVLLLAVWRRLCLTCSGNLRSVKS